jgi:hypothetical protein
LNERTDVRAHNAAQAPTRRTVVRSAAWAVPAVAAVSAAPAFAASEVCTTYNVNGFPFYSGTSSVGGTRRSTWSQTHTAPGSSASVLVQGLATMTGSMRLGGSNNNTTNDNFRGYQMVGGVGQGLCLHQARTTNSGNQPRNHRGAYTFTFGQPVTNLSFYLTDIDYMAGDFADRVELSGAFTYSMPGSNNTVTGAGTQASPFRSSGTVNENDWNSSRGNVLITYPGEITTFTITYWNALTSFSNVDRDQAIYIGNMSFDYEVCV